MRLIMNKNIDNPQESSQQLLLSCNMVQTHMKASEYQLQRLLVHFSNTFSFVWQKKWYFRINSFTFDLEKFAVEKFVMNPSMFVSNPCIHIIEPRHIYYNDIQRSCPKSNNIP